MKLGEDQVKLCELFVKAPGVNALAITLLSSGESSGVDFIDSKAPTEAAVVYETVQTHGMDPFAAKIWRLGFRMGLDRERQREIRRAEAKRT